jgi:CheY-like chemotaxis protein
MERMEQKHHRTILLVEDELQWQTMLTELCAKAGYSVVQVFDANAALQQLESLSPSPVLAIVDLELYNSAPQQDYEGLQFLTILRNRGIYAIVVSGNIPLVRNSLMGRPEIYRLVDKAHFTDADFGDNIFIPWVRDALAYAEAALQAEGELPEQQARLRRLTL